MEKNETGDAILKGARNEDTRELAIEVASIGLEHFIGEGLLKEIPIVRSIVAAGKTVSAVRDELFQQKVAAFLEGRSSLKQEERTKFAEELARDPEQSKRLWEAVFLHLDRLDDVEKAPMLGKMFAAHARGHIDFSQFRRLARGIDAALVSELRILANKDTVKELNSDKFLALLEPAGFAFTSGGTTRLGAQGTQTRLTGAGQLFRKCMLEE